MNQRIKISHFIYLMAAATMGITSCKKENSIASTATTTDASATSATIAVAASSTLRSTDSLYIIQPCPRGAVRDSIAAADLPASIIAYLAANYSGYTFNKAYSIKDSTGAVLEYVTVIYYNDKPVGVAFDSNGNFLKVLEQREKGDLNGKGWHHGGRFEGRGGIIKDTVSVSSLPATITAYYASNYPTDTLLKAFTNRDSSYIVLSKNDGLFASLFDANGSFVKRIELPSKPAIYQVRDLTAVPSSIVTYLEASYPNYIFKNAFALSLNGTIKTYIVVIDANDTKYALEFDATGNFVRVKALF